MSLSSSKTARGATNEGVKDILFKNTLKRPVARAHSLACIEDFLEAVQRKTKMFHAWTPFGYKPYSLFDRQKEWLSLFDDGRPKRRALLASRDKGKSQIVTILGSAWNLYRNPKLRIIIMSFSKEMAQKYVIRIVEVLHSVGVTLEGKAGGFYTQEAITHTPSLIALGLMSSMRGLHCDLIILDDIISINEQYSHKFIKRSRTVMNEASSVSTKIILIGQLITNDDVYFDAYSDNTGCTYLIQSWHGDIPELDKDLEYETQTIGDFDVARNYLGFLSESPQNIFANIAFSVHPPTHPTFAFIDPSAKGQDSTALAIGWIHNARIIVWGSLYPTHWAECLDALVEQVRHCQRVYYEDNQGRSLGHFLRERNIRPIAVTSTANKIAKISNLRALVINQRLLLHNSMEDEAVMAVKSWNPNSEHDDLPDAIAMLVQKIEWGIVRSEG